jgi:hypothetical protein
MTLPCALPLKPFSLCDVAERITALIYQAPIDCPAKARFIWRGHQVQLLVPEPHIATVELCIGAIPFSAENRLLRADILEGLETAAIDMQIGLRIAPGSALWLTASCVQPHPISFEQMFMLASINLLALKPFMDCLAPLLLPAPLDPNAAAA